MAYLAVHVTDKKFLMTVYILKMHVQLLIDYVTLAFHPGTFIAV